VQEPKELKVHGAAACRAQPGRGRPIRRRRSRLHLALVRTVRAVKSMRRPWTRPTMTGRSAKRDPVVIAACLVAVFGVPLTLVVQCVDDGNSKAGAPAHWTDGRRPGRDPGPCVHAPFVNSKRVHSSAPRAMHELT